MDSENNNTPIESISPEEIQFLISEFEKAWDMIFLLDERRIKIIEYYSIVFAGIISFVGSMWVAKETLQLNFISITSTIILSTGVFIGLVVIMLLKSEREANIRYRKKINLIRAIILESSTNPLLVDYLTAHKELGIKILSDKEQPKGWGGTLSRVLIIVSLEIFFLMVGIAIIWLCML